MPNWSIAEFTRYESPDGKIYDFDEDDRFLVSEEGLGMPDIEYRTHRGPKQHGETTSDYRLLPRIIQMIVRQDSCSRSDYWDYRALLLDSIRPNRQNFGTFQHGTLQKFLPNGDKRFIKVVLEKGPVFAPRNMQEWDEWGFTEALRFKASDPVFYDPDQVCKSWLFEEYVHLTFPFVFEAPLGLIFGSALFAYNSDIVYEGTWESYPVIQIVGPIMSPTITNTSINKSIQLDYTVSAGEVITINLTPGNKTVESNLNGNIIGVISTPRDLTSFRILPEPEVANGINKIDVLGSDAVVGVTEIKLAYYNRYIGI
jgi:hypothetical protein